MLNSRRAQARQVHISLSGEPTPLPSSPAPPPSRPRRSAWSRRSGRWASAWVYGMHHRCTTVPIPCERRQPRPTTLPSASCSADKNVGDGKTVNVNGISLSGTDAGNYMANTSASTAANITPEIFIAGTAAADSITLMQDADLQHIDWFLNGSSLGQLAISDASGLTISGNGSTDVIRLDNTNSSPLPGTLHLERHVHHQRPLALESAGEHEPGDRPQHRLHQLQLVQSAVADPGISQSWLQQRQLERDANLEHRSDHVPSPRHKTPPRPPRLATPIPPME